MEAIRSSPLEKLVKRLGSVAFAEHRSTDELSGHQLHDYALKLVGALYEHGRYQDMLHVVCYSYLQPKILQLELKTFQNLLLFASLKAEHYALAFEYLRYLYMFSLTKPDGVAKQLLSDEARHAHYSRVFNGMNYVFCHHQNVSYHRFVMRALTKTPDNMPLHMISGNNSLITGSYRHALGEYLRVWMENKDDPLVCLLIGLTFSHMACKKDISSRHMVAMRGAAFVLRYRKLRGDCQEVYYNVGRLMHQFGIFAGAVHMYEKVLRETNAPSVQVVDEQTGEVRYDLKRIAAHNLALIYESSGNLALAREVLEEFCVI